MATQSTKQRFTVQIGRDGELPYGEKLSADLLSNFCDNVFGTWTRIIGPGQYTSDFLDYHFLDDHRKLVLTIKPEAQFHNKRKITADDIEFCLLRGFFLGNSAYYSGFLRCVEGIDDSLSSPAPGSVAGVRVVAPDTIELRFKYPCPEFIHTLSIPYFSPRAKEEMADDKITFKSVPIGAGPYRIEREDIGRGQYFLVRVWGEGPDRILLQTKSGEAPADVVTEKLPAPENYRVTVSETQSSTLTLFSSNSHPLVREPRVRALFYEIFDRQALVNSAAERPTYSFFMIGAESSSPMQEIMAARQELRQLLAQKPAAELQIEIPVFASSLSGASLKRVEALAVQFKTVGITARFFACPQKFLTREDARRYPFSLWWLVMDPLSPAVMLSSFRQNEAYTFHSIDDPKFARLLFAAESLPDLDARRAAQEDLGGFVATGGYGIPLLGTFSHFFYNPQVIRSTGRQLNVLSIDFTQLTPISG